MNKKEDSTVLVAGASGATGRLLVEQLLIMGLPVKVIVRATSIIPAKWNNNPRITIIKANITEMKTEDLARHIKGCKAVACCLGHNLTLKGMFGKPRKLVTDSVRSLCEAIKANNPVNPVKFILMNTAGNSNRDISEPLSISEKVATGLLRYLLPPHSDNEDAADFLRVTISGKDTLIEWVIVRPDSLIDDNRISEYSLHVSPVRSAIFNPGKTSRINVGHFMSSLISDDDLWLKWKGKMPVIYNTK